MLPKASSGTLGQVFTLDGSASSTASGKPRTYRWTLKSKPGASKAALSDTASEKPFFLLDVAGDYVVSLIVNDGERDSEAVDATITAAVPASTGPVLKFALVETTQTQGPARSGTYRLCDAYRLESHFTDFWSPALDAMTCNMGTGLPADFERQNYGFGSTSISSGGPQGQFGAYMTLAASAFPAGLTPTPVSMSYEAAVNAAGLATTPIGKSNGFDLSYSVPGYGMVNIPDSMTPLQRPKVSYRIVGAALPQNAPQGWDAVVETTVRIEVTGYALPGNTISSRFDAYSKKFSADFSEDFEIDLNAVAHPQFVGDQATYTVNVSHQVAYKRKAN